MSNAAGLLLTVLIIAIVASTALLQQSAVAFYGPEGGDPTMTAVFAAAFVVFSVSALVVRFKAKD